MDINYYTYLQTLLHFTIGLITILNPIAAAVIMISSSSSEVTQGEINIISKKAAMTLLFASLVTILLGNGIFELFGINTSSIMVIGGVILLIMSINMVQGKRAETNHSREESEAIISKEDISVIPIGIPILFGPGVISTLIIFKTKSIDIMDMVLLVISILISVALVYLTLKNAIFFNKTSWCHWYQNNDENNGTYRRSHCISVHHLWDKNVMGKRLVRTLVVF